jgi:hypothetical protein
MLKFLTEHGDKLPEETKARLETSSGLSEIEETVIQFDEATNLATVRTRSWIVARTLKKAGFSACPEKRWRMVVSNTCSCNVNSGR